MSTKTSTKTSAKDSVKTSKKASAKTAPKKLKVVTIGGGSSYTPEIVEGFILRHHKLPITELWLVDIDGGREKLEIVGALAKRMVEKAGINCTVHLTYDRRKALKDADFVTTQIRVGMLDARIRDERIPLKHGLIGQETNGVGGFAKALRTIPVILDICKDMEELCPNAWLINFSNPAGIVTEAVLTHTKLKTVGLCNVPIGMNKMVGEILGRDEKDFLFPMVGMNHFIYGTNVWVDGEDKIKEVIDKIDYDAEARPKNIPNIPWQMEQIRHLGVIPCFYHQYYYSTSDVLEKQLEEYKNNGTRAETVKAVEAELFELYKDVNLQEKPKQLEQRGGAHYSDAACNLISAIYNNSHELMTVNIRNRGTIPNIPYDSAIEATCVVGTYGAIPMNFPQLPPAASGLIALMKSFEQMTVEAAVTGDYGAALQALTLNPLVPSGKIAREMLDEILEANKDYLPQFFPKKAKLKKA